MKYTRRRFLEMVGAITAGAGVSSGAPAQIQPLAEGLNDWSDRTEEWIPSICPLCPGGCGLKVRVINGMPVRIVGNPLHPVNRGTLCPRGLAGLQSLYSPDRIQTPLRRVGSRGSDEWQPISWDEALETVKERLLTVRRAGSPEALVVLGGEYRGMIDQLWARFANAYGTPNYIRLRTFKPEAPDPVAVYMHGEHGPIAYDFRETSFVLSFGCNWLESWISPVYHTQGYNSLRQGHQDHRGQIVHVEPRLSHSAAKADLWVPIKPGTEGVLALGLAHLIIREGLYDSKFIEEHTFGFDDWVGLDGAAHQGFRRTVLQDYAPVSVSEITEIPPETIVTVARRFAGARPAIALSDNRSPLEGHNLFTRMAIHSLNALVGSIGVRGGVFAGQSELPLSPWPEVTLDETAKRGLARERLDRAGVGEHFLDSNVPRRLPQAVLGPASSPVEILILHRANPMFGRPDKDQFRKALEKVPLIVSLSEGWNETNRYADLILPEHNYLERWQDDPIEFLPDFVLLGLGRPTVEPLYDTRHPADVILDLSARIGGVVAEALPWKSYLDMLQGTVKGLFDAHRGYVVSDQNEEMLRRVLERQGYRTNEFESFDEFWQAIADRGAWWDRTESLEGRRQIFFTPSGKFEFSSQILEKQLHEAASATAASTRTVEEQKRNILAALGFVASEGGLSFPSHSLFSRSDEAEAGFPFSLQTYELLSIGDGTVANLPWLQESLAAHVKGSWDSWAEIHPQTASIIGVRDGDWVWIESPVGKLRTRARLYEGMRTDVVALPVGQGHTANGRWSQNRGVDVSDLLVSAPDPGEGFGIRRITHVRIRPA